MQKTLIFYVTVVLLSVGCSTSKKVATEVEPILEATTEFRDLDTMVVSAPKAEIVKAAEDYKLPRYQATYALKNDLIHTKLDLRFDWKKQQVLGKAELVLKPYFYPTSEVQIDAKGFDIHQVALVEGKNKTDLKYEYNGMQLKIQLGRAYTRQEIFEVFIDYTAKPEELLEKYPDQVTPDNRGVFFIDPL